MVSRTQNVCEPLFTLPPHCVYVLQVAGTETGKNVQTTFLLVSSGPVTSAENICGPADDSSCTHFIL